MPKNTYITTAIPYVNGAPHIGHTMDYLLADTYARYRRLKGDNVRFQVGTDEHGSKIFKKASENNQEVQEYVDANSQKFRDFIKKLDVDYTDFVRTTDEDHIRRVREIWRRLEGYIYQNAYEGWYCEGCENFITDKEYEENNGICPDHNKPYEKLSEKNYFLRISDFKEQIKSAIENDEMQILPEFRKKEVLKLLEDTPDVSISRPKEHLSWGVPVPGDEKQVMYVWMDALANYITVLGYPEEDISDFWPARVQFVGKDILRFHAIIWPAMLIGLGLPLPKTLLSHGFVLSNGAKMSKSIGNVIDPLEILSRHGITALRYYFLRHADTFLDADFTDDKFEDAYNNELANDLGNLVQRLAAMSKKQDLDGLDFAPKLDKEYDDIMNSFHFSKAMDYAWERVQAVNKRIDDTKPWTLAKEDKTDELKELLNSLISDLLNANHLLKPFLPEATQKIEEIFTAKKIVPGEPLFPKNR